MKKIKNLSSKTAEQLKKEEEAKALRQQLALGADLLIKEKASDKYLDKRIEKVELISGETINLKELRQYLDDKINTYEKRFEQVYYLEIFRLNGWPIPKNGIISEKPSIVGKYTNDIIYGRFPKEVLHEIQDINKFDNIAGMRLYKHFQFLNPNSVLKLDQYIKESIIVMKACGNWDEFVAEHAKKYGHPFQTSLFN